MGRLWHLVISLVLTVFIGYLVYRGVPDWGEATRVMLKANPLWLLSGLAFITLHMVMRAERWGVLLSHTKKGIAWKNLLTLTLVKYVINVIPPRVGELVASLLLARKEKIPAASVVAASLFERILDMLAVVVLFGFYLLFFAHLYMPNSDRGEEIILAVRRHSILVFLVLSVGIGILTLLLRSSRWHGCIPGPIRRLVLSFVDGFRALHSASAVARVLFLSVAIWLVITAQLWCLTLAYLDDFPFTGTLLIMALTVIGVAIPTPGGVGGFQFFMNLALIHFFAAYLSGQDPRSQAAGISNGCYIVSMVPVILVGLWFLNREGLTFGRLTELTREAGASRHTHDGERQ
ncbi:MAG: flippase-like domain-containing protein [Acidobacteria bacterium]|nr:flippase-like domain-containing protein [Acidobacteriota bacterium]